MKLDRNTCTITKGYISYVNSMTQDNRSVELCTGKSKKNKEQNNINLAYQVKEIRKNYHKSPVNSKYPPSIRQNDLEREKVANDDTHKWS